MAAADQQQGWSLPLAFTLVSLSTGVVNLLFNTFHVELFLKVYGLSPVSFASCHAVFSVWNTTNDLCSGWFADWLAARTGNRIGLIRIGGLAWVTVGFLFPWWRWGMPLWLQFLLALSLFDGFYSFVAIVNGALLADITHDTTTRATIGQVSVNIRAAHTPTIPRIRHRQPFRVSV